MLAFSYKQLFEVVEAVEFKVAAEKARPRRGLSEGECVDLDHDVTFLEEILKQLQSSLHNWQDLPSGS